MKSRRSDGSHRMPCRRWPSRAIAASCRAGPSKSSPVARPSPTRGDAAVARKSIVTKTGDGGDTGLLYGGRVSKTDPRTEAYGSVDEAISALGSARALIKDRGRHGTILRVQTELFTVGAELAPDPAEYDNLAKHFKVVTDDFTNRV